MLRKIFEGGLEAVLNHETAARASSGAMAGLAFAAGLYNLTSFQYSAADYWLLGAGAAAAAYVTYTCPLWGAARLLKETGKGIGYLFRRKKKPESQENAKTPLYAMPLEHPSITASAVTAAYTGIALLYGKPGIGTYAAYTSPAVFAASYAFASLASILFHPRNFRKNRKMLLAEICDVFGMRKTARRIMEKENNPKTREQMLYLASLYMKQGETGKALTRMRESNELSAIELYHPFPAVSNIAHASVIGNQLAKAARGGSVEDLVTAAVGVYPHSREKSLELWARAADCAPEGQRLEIKAAEAYFLNSARDNAEILLWKEVLEGIDGAHFTQIGDCRVYRLDFGTLLKEAFAFKEGDENHFFSLREEEELTRLHHHLVSTDEFLTAEPIGIIHRENKYYLATKYARGKMLSESGSLDDYLHAAKFLAREHALMPLSGRSRSQRAKFSSSVQDSPFSPLVKKGIIWNSDPLFFFEQSFPPVRERDAHDEQWAVAIGETKRTIALDIEDKGDCPPYEDVAKLMSYGGKWQPEQKAEIAGAYTGYYSNMHRREFPDPTLLLPAARLSSLGCSIRYACFALKTDEKRRVSRLKAAAKFLRSGIDDSRQFLKSPPPQMAAAECRQVESLASIAESSIIPYITVA